MASLRIPTLHVLVESTNGAQALCKAKSGKVGPEDVFEDLKQAALMPRCKKCTSLLKKKKEKEKSVKFFEGTKIRVFTSEGDGQYYAKFVDGERVEFESNIFVFTGFSNKLHPYYKTQLNWLKKILLEAGIELNVNVVPTVNDITPNIDKGYLDPGDIKIDTAKLKVSADGNCYYLILDEEMGRGWAVFMKQDANGLQTIFDQEHRDTVLEHMIANADCVLSQFGVDYATDSMKNMDKYVKPKTAAKPKKEKV